VKETEEGGNNIEERGTYLMTNLIQVVRSIALVLPEIFLSLLNVKICILWNLGKKELENLVSLDGFIERPSAILNDVVLIH